MTHMTREDTATNRQDRASASDAVRSMPDQFRTLFDSASADASRMDRSTQRPDPKSPSAVEHVLCLRDIIEATAERLERLSRDARPVCPRAHRYGPVAGYHRWDPEELLRTLATEAERLARVAEELSSSEAFPVEVRLGMESIAGELLRHVLRYAAAELGEAELALKA